ncbi:hypothetical protein MCOR25_009679 [Pyricularia grisea]|uniref:ER membrane protein complex subunit 10 n=1 Tax=Pyricularia grisea TaxID=148305 RepID=A0A6P8BH48_PYRGI|nr:uncharacterized protein PgNI_00051 [Pyricularia grisea]KAI6351916.1 hypothetical protein MCOR25_009679 [Pyricularia grisea]TLD15977.1 hypothetical protein PgNI_00051 [Pyricularia grisea]
MKLLCRLCFTVATASLQFSYGSTAEVRAIAAGMQETSVLLSRLSLHVQSPRPRLVTLREGASVSPPVIVRGHESASFIPMDTHSYIVEVNDTADDMLATIQFASQARESSGTTMHVARRTSDGNGWILDMTQIGKLRLMGSLAGEYLLVERRELDQNKEEAELRRRREEKVFTERAQISDQCAAWLRYCAATTSDPRQQTPPARPPAPMLGPPQTGPPGLGPVPESPPNSNSGNGLGPPATDRPSSPSPAMQNIGGPFQTAPSSAIRQGGFQGKWTLVVVWLLGVLV